VVGGFIATNHQELYERLALFQKNFGAILGVEDAWLILRGMKTMGLRMEKSVSNAEKMAEFLQKHPHISNVYYPALENHPNATIHLNQACNGGAVLSFEIEDQATFKRFIENMSLPIYAVSLGGVESIIS